MIIFFGNLKSPLIRERAKALKTITTEKITFVNDISKERIRDFDNSKVFNQSYTRFRILNYLVNSIYTLILLIVENPKIIVIHWASRILQGLVLSLWGKKVIVHTMGGDIDENQDAKGYKRFFTNILLKRAKIITVKSNEMKEMIVRNFPKVDSNKIKILTWGVSQAFIKKGERISRSEIPTFFCFRACQPLYEKEIILKAFSKLIHEYDIDSKLIVSIHRKDESYLNLLLKLADELNILKFIDWVDVEHEDMPIFIKKSWATVSAYRFDGFSQSLLESWALKTWPIFRNSHAHSKYLIDYENCLVYENLDELSEKMLWVVNNYEKEPTLSDEISLMIDYNYQNKKYKNYLRSINDVS